MFETKMHITAGVFSCNHIWQLECRWMTTAVLRLLHRITGNIKLLHPPPPTPPTGTAGHCAHPPPAHAVFINTHSQPSCSQVYDLLSVGPVQRLTNQKHGELHRVWEIWPSTDTSTDTLQQGPTTLIQHPFQSTLGKMKRPHDTQGGNPQFVSQAIYRAHSCTLDLNHITSFFLFFLVWHIKYRLD